MTNNNGSPANPRPYGRQPVALRGLAESIALQLERELRAAAIDSALGIKAYWLRAGDADSFGWPDYAHAYVWIAPVLMSPTLCQAIEPFVAQIRGVVQTGRGGGDPGTNNNPLRPFVYAVVDLKARRS